MKVTLIDSAGGDLSVVNSARVSFNKEVTELSDKDEKLIMYLAEHKHHTPFRHNFIQLRCEAPVFLARQLMKHQAGLTWNEESRRYIDYTPELYMPKVWRKRPEGGIKQGSSGVIDLDKLNDIDGRHIKDYWHETTGPVLEGDYHDGIYPETSVLGAIEFHMNEALDLYERLLKLDVAPEQARMVLPQNMMIKFIWSGNLLAFHHVYSLRSGDGAQEEARIFADLLKRAIEPVFPISWKALEKNT